MTIINEKKATKKKVTPKRQPGEAPLRSRRSYRMTVVPDNTPDTSRVCVLTGASGLLGTEFIKRYALDYKIIAIHHEHDILPPQELIDPLYSTFPIQNPHVDPIRCDLSIQGEINELAKFIIEKHSKVDLLINAACVRNAHHLLEPDALSRAKASYAINVVAPLVLSVALMKHFWLPQGWEENGKHNRNIVNLSSTAGSYVYPDQGQTLYCSSKAALNFASHHMASEFWDYGIRVNVISPNTFPGIVPTQAVLDQIIGFDKGRETGQLVLIDKE